MKKTICLLMAIAMLVCSIPFGAFAVGEGYSSWEVHMWNGVESLNSTRPFELEEVEYEGTVYGATATDKGFVDGNMDEGTKATVTMGYMGNSNWGSDNASVDTPLQTINYASCHDNYTLFDNLTVDAMDMTGLTAAEVAGMAAEMNNLAAAYYITAQGVPFIHAGEEMLRSKPDARQENGFNHNSYASAQTVTLPEGEWNVCVNKDEAGTEVLATVSGTVEVEATSAMILVKHVHSYTSEVVEPICTDDGYTVYTCECGDSYTDDYVEATGHKYGRKGICAFCGEKKNQDKPGHGNKPGKKSHCADTFYNYLF